MNRRKFVTLVAGAGAGFCAGCQSTGGARVSGDGRVIDAGPAGAYAAAGVYGKFRDEGFFVVSRDGKQTALSSICPHRQCTVEVEADCSFYCPCHGSTFDPSGKVTQGPATRDLPMLSTVEDGQGNLFVKVV